VGNRSADRRRACDPAVRRCDPAAGSRLKARTRSQKVPELAKAVASLKLDSAQLDGEMIVPTETGSDFNALQGRLGAENKAPLRYMLFDAPCLDGEDLHAQPLIERKARLEKLLKKSRD